MKKHTHKQDYIKKHTHTQKQLKQTTTSRRKSHETPGWTVGEPSLPSERGDVHVECLAYTASCLNSCPPLAPWMCDPTIHSSTGRHARVPTVIELECVIGIPTMLTVV